MGSQAASLLSVVISQLYSSPFNNDDVKKLITFSDSVQDASHRAGFFGARTYRFNFRSALQQFLQNCPDKNIRLTEMPEEFIKFYKEQWTENEFIAYLLPSDMAWKDDYEILMETGKLPKDSKLLWEIEQRISWEIYSEYGHNSRLGRTLEKTGCSIAEFSSKAIENSISSCLEKLQNEIGGLRNMTAEELQAAVEQQTPMMLSTFAQQGLIKETEKGYETKLTLKDGEASVNGTPIPLPFAPQ